MSSRWTKICVLRSYLNCWFSGFCSKQQLLFHVTWSLSEFFGEGRWWWINARKGDSIWDKHMRQDKTTWGTVFSHQEKSLVNGLWWDTSTRPRLSQSRVPPLSSRKRLYKRDPKGKEWNLGIAMALLSNLSDGNQRSCMPRGDFKSREVLIEWTIGERAKVHEHK